MIPYPAMLVKIINQAIPFPPDAPRPFQLQPSSYLRRRALFTGFASSLCTEEIHSPKPKKPEICVYFKVIKSYLPQTVLNGSIHANKAGSKCFAGHPGGHPSHCHPEILPVITSLAPA